MKKMIVLALIAILALSGCVNGKYLGFIATSDYVDQKIKDQEAEIAVLKAQIADYQALKAQTQLAIEQVNQSQKAIQDLQAMGQKVEARLGAIPNEVIKQIVDALQASLGH